MDFTIKSLDHLGVVAGVMQDLKLSELIDELLPQDAQVVVTSGNAVTAMILNGLGFSNRVISLTPQFFSNKPVDLLIRKGIKADQLNRHKLGRTLDVIADYGCEKFFNEIALSICVAEKVDLRKAHDDTTTFSVAGTYENQHEDAEVYVTYGYSKAKRPDLKQIILELCASSDGSVPFMMKPWSGNAADNKIFNARIKAMKEAAAESHTGRTLIGDAKFYTEENIRALGKSPFVTRVPASIKQEGACIERSLRDTVWTQKDKNYKFRPYDLEHYGTEMRWVVFYSQHAHERVKKTLIATITKQGEQLKKDLFHLQAQRFACSDDAKEALAVVAKKYAFYQISCSNIVAIQRYVTAGRPTNGAKKVSVGYQIEASFEKIQSKIEAEIEHRSCFVLATNIPEMDLPSANVLDEYKGQDCVEKCFEFMKAPSFFAASFFVKNVKRIQAMLVIMTLALLIYTVAQRRFRQWLKDNKKTIPSQIKKPLVRPTLRWAFQLLEGIYYVAVFTVEGQIKKAVQGLTDLRTLILSSFGETVMKMYGIEQPFDAPSG